MEALDQAATNELVKTLRDRLKDLDFEVFKLKYRVENLALHNRELIDHIKRCPPGLSRSRPLTLFSTSNVNGVPARRRSEVLNIHRVPDVRFSAAVIQGMSF